MQRLCVSWILFPTRPSHAGCLGWMCMSVHKGVCACENILSALIHTHAYTETAVCVLMHACVYACVCVCVKMHACKYVRMYVRTYGLRMYTTTRIHAQVNLDKSVYWRLAAAGAICASIGHGLLVPLDTVKTRMQTAPPGKYENTMDAFVKVLRDEGGGRLYCGACSPRWSALLCTAPFRLAAPNFAAGGLLILLGPRGPFCIRSRYSCSGVPWQVSLPLPQHVLLWPSRRD